LRRCPLVSYMPTPSPTPISPLSLHDALPIFAGAVAAAARRPGRRAVADRAPRAERREARARRAGHADAEPRAAPRDARAAVRRARGRAREAARAARRPAAATAAIARAVRRARDRRGACAARRSAALGQRRRGALP